MSAANTQQLIQDNQPDQKLVGIRGWLTIPAICLIILPQRIIDSILNISRSLIGMMDLDIGAFRTLKVILHIAIPFYIICVIVRFFDKHRKGTKTSIYLIAIQLIAPTLLLFHAILGLLIRLKIRGMITISDDMTFAIQAIALKNVVLFYIFIAGLRFLTKSQRAPLTCIRCIVIYYVVVTLELILLHVFVGSEAISARKLVTDFVLFVIIVVIWILYFKVSKRVKATFVNPEDSIGLPYKIVLPLRYFLKRRITHFAVLAVALCVFIVVVVMTVMTGLVGDFKQKNYDFVGDCVVGTESLVGFAYYEEFVNILQQQNDFVQAVSPVIKSYGLLSPKGSTQNRGLEIMGIDPVKHSWVTGFGKTLQYRTSDVSRAFEPSYDPNLLGCVLGIDVALRRDANSRYFFTSSPMRAAFSISCFPLTSRGALLRAGTGLVNTKTFYYSDISQSGLARVDSSLIYLPFEQAQELCGMDRSVKRVSAVHIKFKPDVKLQAGCEKVNLLWQKFKQNKANEKQAYLLDTVKVQSWKDYRRSSIAPMENEQTELIVMFAFVGITNVFIVLVVFYMIISHKTKDIGILKSIGVSNIDVMELFSGFAVLVGCLGSCIGLYSGWLFLLTINRIEAWLFEHFGFQLWDRTMYAIEDIPNRMSPKVMAVIALSAIVACLAGALIPSWQAARQKPIETLQVNQFY